MRRSRYFSTRGSNKRGFGPAGFAEISKAFNAISRVVLPTQFPKNRQESFTWDFTQNFLPSVITFSRAGGASYFAKNGLFTGFDTSVTSVAIGTGSVTFTLQSAVNNFRDWVAGATVSATSIGSSANSMTGTVTSYNPATQQLVCNMTLVSGSGTFANWILSRGGPRFTHDADGNQLGFLVESSATNSVLASADLTNSLYWTASAINTTGWTNNTAPDGSSNAIKITPNTVSSGVHALQGTGVAMLAGTVYTVSAFVKANGVTRASLVVDNSETRRSFDLSGNGAVGTGTAGSTNTGSIQKLANGWFRISMTFTAVGTLSGMWVGVPADTTSDPVTAWAGDNTNGILMWGPQFEANNHASSHIPTGSVTATRSADQATMFGASFSGTFPAITSFSVGWTGRLHSNNISAHLFNFCTGSAAPRAMVTASNGNLRQDVENPAATFVCQSTIFSGYAANTEYRVACRYSTNDYFGTVNGNAGVADTLGAMPTTTNFWLGAAEGGYQFLNGTIKSFTYWPYLLTDEQAKGYTV